MKEKYFTCENISAKADKMYTELIMAFPQRESNSITANTALLVLDMQDFFANPESHAYIPSIKVIIPNIIRLIELFESQSLPVIFTKHINTQANAALMGEWWNDLITEDRVINELNTKNHIIIEKSQYDAFYNTELEAILAKNNIKNIVITGVMTHLCCETTARSAFVRGFQPVIVIDGTATYTERFHMGSLWGLMHGFAKITSAQLS